MATKSTGRAKTARGQQAAAPADAMKAACESHTLAQLVFRHLVATGRMPGWTPGGVAGDPRASAFHAHAAGSPKGPTPWSATPGAVPPPIPGPWTV